jgi:excisionase family DNA binding protein
MSDDWLTAQQAAELLGCTDKTIRGMLRDELLRGRKLPSGEWRVSKADIESLLHWSSARQLTPTSEPLDSAAPVESGMVEASMALAGIAAAIAAFLSELDQNAVGDAFYFTLPTTFLSGVLAILSSYSALWLLARYYLREISRLGIEENGRLSQGRAGCRPRWFATLGFEEILLLLKNPSKRGPYWFVALGLLVWLVLSAFIGSLAVIRLFS